MSTAPASLQQQPEHNAFLFDLQHGNILKSYYGLNMATSDYASTLATLKAQQSVQPLSILALAEPITASQTQQEQQDEQQSRSHSQSRPSDTLSTAESHSSLLTPASLAADLAHYKDLFSKLRFSYLEQVTKEKYLRSIVGDPPLVVSHADNLLLEEKLGQMKAELKARKQEVDTLIEEMEATARRVASAYEKNQADMDVLERVPAEIDQVKREIEALQAQIATKRGDDGVNDASSDPRMHLPLPATEAALVAQRARNEEIDKQIELLQRAMQGKDREVEKMDRELGELEKKRNESVKAAVEVRRRHEEGGRDEMEEMGRWYRASEVVLRGLLGVEG